MKRYTPYLILAGVLAYSLAAWALLYWFVTLGLELIA